MFRFVLLCVGMSALISGCALQEFGSSLRYNIKGEYYLQQNNFEGGRQAFEEALQTDPASPQALYYYGRFLLAEDQAGAALPYLEKAVTYNPGDAEYHYWLGTAFGANDMSRKERASYETALRLDPKHGPAMTALANNLLQAGELERSYQLYQEALQLWPENPQALYNRGVILKKLGREPEEKQAWKLYLDSYPSGSFARIATERLNSLGDSSYRNYQLGARTVTLSRIIFLPLSAELSPATLPSLDLVGTAVSNMNTGKLDIIVYQQNNPELAKQRALSIRFYLEKKFPNLRRDKRIRLSWFGIPEERTVLGRKVVLDESVQMFLAENGIPKVEAEPESAGTTPSPQKMHKLQ
jgi:tetratricopeptide (TPR) repeat protein